MWLLLDTASSIKFQVALVDNNGKLSDYKEIKEKFSQAEKILPVIDRLLQKNKIKPTQLAGIAAVVGPGAFTALRIGVGTANALAFAWSKPILGLTSKPEMTLANLVSQLQRKQSTAKLDRYLAPVYGQPPNITKAKEKVY